MALLLHIETSAKSCSVALSLNGNVIDCVEEHAEEFVHAEKLHVFIDTLFTKSVYHIEQLNAVHISAGPGSFTGLRIGISAAKGICYGLSIPLIQSNSLDVLFHSFKAQHADLMANYFIPMIDARRMEVYCSVLDSLGKQVEPTQSKIIDEGSFSQLNGKVVLFGDGADKLESIVFTQPDIEIVKGIKPSASAMVNAGFNLYQINEFEDIAYFNPNYLKEFASGK
jgi:tRNA threonylcarbamoyladenosine biosynthesis protein TsaB